MHLQTVPPMGSTSMSRTPVLSMLGAGHLATAMIDCWRRVYADQCVAVFSRSGMQSQRRDASMQSADVKWLTDADDLFDVSRLVLAIPGDGVVDMFRNNDAARCYQGTIYCAAISLNMALLKCLFPAANIIRLSPFLLPGNEGVHMLAYAGDQASIEYLACFGSVDVIESERAFEILTPVGSPWPLILTMALHQSLDSLFADAGMCESDVEKGKKLFWQAMSAFSGHELNIDDTFKSIASKGGITEAGSCLLPEIIKGNLSSIETMARKQHDLMRQSKDVL